MANTFVTVPDGYCLAEPIQYYGEQSKAQVLRKQNECPQQSWVCFLFDISLKSYARFHINYPVHAVRNVYSILLFIHALNGTYLGAHILLDRSPASFLEHNLNPQTLTAGANQSRAHSNYTIYVCNSTNCAK